MTKKSEFDRLEQFVSKLLNQYDQLREKNTELQTLLQQREDEIVELKENLNTADTERGDITDRVKGIIGQIEEWETAIEEGETEETTMEEGTLDADTQEDTEDVEEEEDLSEEEGDGEKDGGLQQNLFSVEPLQDEKVG